MEAQFVVDRAPYAHALGPLPCLVRPSLGSLRFLRVNSMTAQEIIAGRWTVISTVGPDLVPVQFLSCVDSTESQIKCTCCHPDRKRVLS